MDTVITSTALTYEATSGDRCGKEERERYAKKWLEQAGRTACDVDNALHLKSSLLTSVEEARTVLCDYKKKKGKKSSTQRKHSSLFFNPLAQKSHFSPPGHLETQLNSDMRSWACGIHPKKYTTYLISRRERGGEINSQLPRKDGIVPDFLHF